MSKAYKVFERNLKGKLRSIGELPEYLKQTYSPSRVNFSKVKGGKIFCFTNLDAARSYVLNSCPVPATSSVEIWEVEAETVKRINRGMTVWLWPQSTGMNKDKISALEFFWKDFERDNLSDRTLGRICDDAYCADSVRLIKKINL